MNTVKPNRLIKISKIIFKSILKASLVLAILILATFITHRICLKIEESKIVDYGQKIKVFDGTMNVSIDGIGKDTIVLLTGFGTSSPRLDFTPIINELSSKFTIVTIEPFGYGLSSQTERDRSVENMAEEIHEVTSQLKIKHFILMGHSISGLYSLEYVNKYPGQATAFIGIDSSVPKQPWPGYNSTVIDLLAKAGVVRAIVKVTGNKESKNESEVKLNEQMHMISMKVTGNKTIAREASSLSKTFLKSKELAFPKELPVLLFADINSPVQGWVELHQEQANSVNKGKLILLKGSHYLHHTQSERIANEIELFLGDN